MPQVATISREAREKEHYLRHVAAEAVALLPYDREEARLCWQLVAEMLNLEPGEKAGPRWKRSADGTLRLA
jgi:hypothetical protein